MLAARFLCLGEYDSYIPSAPEIYEPNSVEFGGWYLNAECSGEEFVLADHTMPADNVLLYAKWIPVTHSVKFFKDDTMAEPVGTDLTVSHGSMIPQMDVPKVTNGQYQFVGWFYKDNGEEKAFDPENMPVTHDLELYAKWSSNTLVEYKIHYQLEDGTTIADDTTGSALAGSTKTFEAKAGDQLKEAYRQGYFPETNSHSLTMNIEGDNEFTFRYVQMPEVSYTVKYLEEGTGNVLHEEKQGKTSNAVITENFVPVTGYMPDAYQKRLVLSATEDENVIIFWYTKDDVHAPVQITHYVQNVEGDEYTIYQDTTDLNGVINDEYSTDVLVMDGFTFDHATANDAPVTIQDGKVTATVTAEGLHLELYYNREEYPYEFRFLEQGTNNQLHAPVTGEARYQAQVTQSALEIPGYTCVSEESLAINIQKEDSAVKNVQTFYYTELEVTITYQAVGPDGMDNFGSVNPHENKFQNQSNPSGTHRKSRRLRWRKQFVVLVSVVVLLMGFVGGSLAWLVAETDSKTNEFTYGWVSCSVENNAVRNTGNTDAKIRAAVVVYWQDDEGGVFHGEPVFTVTGEGWERNGDFYYYNPVVPADGTTKPLNIDSEAPEGYHVCYEILADAIQSKPDTIDVWG